MVYVFYVFVGPHKLSLECVFTVLMSVEIYTRFKWNAHNSGIPKCSQGNVHFFLCSINARNMSMFIEEHSITKKLNKKRKVKAKRSN